ncbi:hypothetical protein MT418_006599 [Batrachochytrium dendrobatidis]
MSGHLRCASAAELTTYSHRMGVSPLVAGLSLSAYDQRIIDLLLFDDASLLEIVCLSSFVGDTAAAVSKGVLTLLRYRNPESVESFLKRIFRTRAIEYVCKSRDLSDIIRDNSMATMLLNTFAKSDGYGFLSISLTAPLNGIFHTLDSCEIDQTKLRYAQESKPAMETSPTPELAKTSEKSDGYGLLSISLTAPLNEIFHTLDSCEIDPTKLEYSQELKPAIETSATPELAKTSAQTVSTDLNSTAALKTISSVPLVETLLETNRKNLRAACTRLFTHVFENRKRMPPSLRRMCQFIFETVNEMATISPADLADRVREVKRRASIVYPPPSKVDKMKKNETMSFMAGLGTGSGSGSERNALPKTIGKSSTVAEIMVGQPEEGTDGPTCVLTGLSGTAKIGGGSHDSLHTNPVIAQRKLMRIISFKKKNKIAESSTSLGVKDGSGKPNTFSGITGNGNQGNCLSKGSAHSSSQSYGGRDVKETEHLTGNSFSSDRSIQKSGSGQLPISKHRDNVEQLREHGLSMNADKLTMKKHSPRYRISTTELSSDKVASESNPLSTSFALSSLSSPAESYMMRFSTQAIATQPLKSSDSVCGKPLGSELDSVARADAQVSSTSGSRNSTVTSSISPFSLAFPTTQNSSQPTLSNTSKNAGSISNVSMFSASPRSAGCLTIAEKVVGSFLFLRFFVPAITSPESNALLLAEKLTTPRRRGLVLCGKLLTALCNDIEFGNKEDYLMVFNEYLKDYREAMKDYIAFASTPDPVTETVSCVKPSIPEPTTPSRGLVRDLTITKSTPTAILKSDTAKLPPTLKVNVPDLFTHDAGVVLVNAQLNSSVSGSQPAQGIHSDDSDPLGSPSTVTQENFPAISSDTHQSLKVKDISLAANTSATESSAPLPTALECTKLQRQVNRPKVKPGQQKSDCMSKSNPLSRSMPSLIIDTKLKAKLLKDKTEQLENEYTDVADKDNSVQTTPTKYTLPQLPFGDTVPLSQEKSCSTSDAGKRLSGTYKLTDLQKTTNPLTSLTGGSSTISQPKILSATVVEADLTGFFQCLVKSIDRVEREVEERVYGIADANLAQSVMTNFADLKSLLEHGPYSDLDRSIAGGAGLSKKKPATWWSRIFKGGFRRFR